MREETEILFYGVCALILFVTAGVSLGTLYSGNVLDGVIRGIPLSGIGFALFYISVVAWREGRRVKE